MPNLSFAAAAVSIVWCPSLQEGRVGWSFFWLRLTPRRHDNGRGRSCLCAACSSDRLCVSKGAPVCVGLWVSSPVPFFVVGYLFASGFLLSCLFLFVAVASLDGLALAIYRRLSSVALVVSLVNLLGALERCVTACEVFGYGFLHT